jgi:hypothetical protein
MTRRHRNRQRGYGVVGNVFSIATIAGCFVVPFTYYGLRPAGKALVGEVDRAHQTFQQQQQRGQGTGSINDLGGMGSGLGSPFDIGGVPSSLGSTPANLGSGYGSTGGSLNGNGSGSQGAGSQGAGLQTASGGGSNSASGGSQSSHGGSRGKDIYATDHYPGVTKPSQR